MPVIQEMTTKVCLVTFIGINVLSEIIRLRLSTIDNNNIQFLTAVFMILFYFVFLCFLLTKQTSNLFRMKKLLFALLLLSIITFMGATFIIANNQFEHVFKEYLNYVYASLYMAFSLTIQSILLESYLRKVTADEADEEKKDIYP